MTEHSENSSAPSNGVEGGADLQPGTFFDRKFRIIKLIGKGGFGTVYLVEHELGWRLALKILHPEFGSKKPFRERFLREMKIARALSHENFTPIRDAGIAQGDLYYTMDFIVGRSMSQVIEEEGPIAPGRAIDWGLQVLSFLKVLHGKKYVHRDIKPSNLMVEKEGDFERIRVLDLGIAKSIATEGISPLSDRMTIGTPHYMAPEQITGEAVDHRIDFYSLGVTMYECCSGKKPFDAPTYQSLTHLILTEDPVPLHQMIPDFPRALWDAIARALEKKRENRFKSSDAFSEAIRKRTAESLEETKSVHLEGIPGTQEPVEPQGEERRLATMAEPPEERKSVQVGPRPWGKFLFLLILLALLPVLIFLWLKIQSGSRKPPDDRPPELIEIEPPPGAKAFEDSSLLMSPLGRIPAGMNPIEGITRKDPFGSQWATPVKEPRTGIEMVLIPPTPQDGFLLGALESDPFAQDDEKPRCPVRITKPFYLSRTEVTWANWEQARNANAPGVTAIPTPSHWNGEPRITKEHPVVFVHWKEAAAFAKWLNMRLPTEAEWEWACRVDSPSSIYLWGSQFEDGMEWANVLDQARTAIYPARPEDLPSEESDGFVNTAPSALLKPSPKLGLSNLIGNVLEWCEDAYSETTYKDLSGRIPSDPIRLPEGPGPHLRCLRGGSFKSGAKDSRISRRWKISDDVLRPRFDDVGFRVCLDPR